MIALFVLLILLSGTADAGWIEVETLITEAALAPPHAEPVLADWTDVARYRLRQEFGVALWSRIHFNVDLKVWLGVPWQQPCKSLPEELQGLPTWNGSMCQKAGLSAWHSTDWSPDGYRTDLTTRLWVDLWKPVSVLWERNVFQNHNDLDKRGTHYNLIGLKIDWTYLWRDK